MHETERILGEVARRLKTRGDTFLDSDGEQLFDKLEKLAVNDSDAAEAVKEIKLRRSEKIE